jgi:hypothetical protein
MLHRLLVIWRHEKRGLALAAGYFVGLSVLTTLAARQLPVSQGTPVPVVPLLPTEPQVVARRAMDTPTPTTVPPATPTPLPSATSVPQISPSPSPTLVSPSTLTPTLPVWYEYPLAQLSPQAAAFLASREGAAGVAVVVPDRRAIYTSNGRRLFHLASVAKVVILLTLLDQAVDEGRELTDYERAMLEPMITLSWNDGATELWGYVGGDTAIRAYLDSIDMTEIVPDPDGAWGASEGSAPAVARLLTKLVMGEILDPPRRALALDLLGQVAAESMDEGVLAGLPTALPPGTRVGLKDGWYPAEDGWWINSAGFVTSDAKHPTYALALLTSQQPDMEYAFTTVESTARLLHASLYDTPLHVPVGGH